MKRGEARGRLAPRDPAEARAMAVEAARAASDNKARDIAIFEVTALTSYTDFVVLCCGRSDRQVATIADGILLHMKERGWRALGSEGMTQAHWVLLDFGAVIVHVLFEAARDFYDL